MSPKICYTCLTTRRAETLTSSFRTLIAPSFATESAKKKEREKNQRVWINVAIRNHLILPHSICLIRNLDSPSMIDLFTTLFDYVHPFLIFQWMMCTIRLLIICIFYLLLQSDHNCFLSLALSIDLYYLSGYFFLFFWLTVDLRYFFDCLLLFF